MPLFCLWFLSRRFPSLINRPEAAIDFHFLSARTDGYWYPPILRHSGVSLADKRRAFTPFGCPTSSIGGPGYSRYPSPFEVSPSVDVVSKLSDIFSLLLWFDVKNLEKVCLLGVKGWATTLRSLFTGLREIQSKSLKDLRIHASPPTLFDDRFPYDALEVAWEG